MLDDVLKKRGEAIIAELELENDQTTEKWMAHYLAELMQQAENLGNEAEGKKCKQQCADLILVLWDQRKKLARQAIYSALNSRLNRVDRLPELDKILSTLMNEPDYVNEIKDLPDAVYMLFYMDFYETDLLRLFLIADVVAMIDKNEAAQEVISEFEDAEEVYRLIKQQLQIVWPELANFSLKDTKSLLGSLQQILLKFRQIRERLTDKILT